MGKATLSSGGRPSKEAEERFVKGAVEVLATVFPTPEGRDQFEPAALNAAAYP